MFDKSKVEKNEAQFQNLYGNLNTTLKASSVSYTSGEAFYREYSDFITTLSQTFEDLQSYTQKNLANYAKTQEDAKAKAKKEGDFSSNAEEFVRAKTQELIKKNKFLEDLKAKMKEALAPLDAKKFAKLKVKETPQLQNLLNTLFKVFYKDSSETFEWKKFQKYAVEKDQLQEFQSRLVGADWSQLPKEDTDAVIALKNDTWYDNFAKTDKSGENILCILNYFEYVKIAAATQEEVDGLQTEITRMKADGPTRGEISKSEFNWAELTQQNLDHLENLNARMVKAAEPFAQEASRTNEMATTFDNHKNEIQNWLNNEYSAIQYVPRTVYGEQ